MAEWSIAAVLKTVVLRGTGGSNPSLSARKSLKRRKSVDYDAFLLLCSSVMKTCMHLFSPLRSIPFNRLLYYHKSIQSPSILTKRARITELRFSIS